MHWGDGLQIVSGISFSCFSFVQNTPFTWFLFFIKFFIFCGGMKQLQCFFWRLDIPYLIMRID